MTFPTITEVLRLLHDRQVTVGGVVVAVLRVSVQQALSEAGTDLVRPLLSATDGLLPRFDWMAGSAGAAATLNAWTCGLLGVLVLLVLPVGGPVWAGMVPVGTTVAGIRRGVGWTRVRVSRNAPIEDVLDDGAVPLTLLIVDDSAPFRELAERILTRDGFTVVGTAASSAEALASVAVLQPQVVLVDINLGADSGFDLARRLTSDPGAPAVVLMSTHCAESLADLIAQSPAVGFVPKERLSGAAVRDLLGDAD